jgi:hypothetical protein
MTNDVLDAPRAAVLERRPDLDPAALEDAATLAELGIDSLGVVDLILTFAERSGGDPEVLLDGLEPPQTLGELLTILNRFTEAE